MTNNLLWKKGVVMTVQFTKLGRKYQCDWLYIQSINSDIATKLLCRGRILGRNPDKSLGVVLLAIHSYLYSFAFRFVFLQTHGTSYNFFSSVTVHCKGERRKPDRKPYPFPYGLKNPYRNLKSENSQDYAQKHQRNVTFMNSASGQFF